MPRRRRSPLWAKLLAIFGALLVVSSGTALAGVNFLRDRYEDPINQGDLFRDEASAPSVDDLDGPMNILLAGLDTRPSRPEEPPLADTIIIVHITADMKGAYLISLPRDTLVEIPPFEPTGYVGQQQAKLNSAMANGAQQQAGEELPDVARGFALLSETVSQLTGIARFDAGAVINFTGFTDIVDAMEGITVTLDAPVTSRHRKPNGEHRPVQPDQHGYMGPQMVYEPGSPPCGPADDEGVFTCELEGWQALDIARQRYGVEDSDYGRQQHQQLILQAMMDKALSRDMITDPLTLDRVITAAGKSLTFDGRGHDPFDFAFALRNLRPADLVMVRVDAGAATNGGDYLGEELGPRTYELFEAIRNGTVAEFLVDNNDMVQ